MSEQTLTPRQRQTAAGRAAFAATFPSPEARASYYRDLAERSAARRRGGVILSQEQAEAFASAYRLLEGVAALVLNHAAGQKDAAGDQPAASDAEVSRASGDHTSS